MIFGWLACFNPNRLIHLRIASEVVAGSLGFLSSAIAQNVASAQFEKKQSGGMKKKDGDFLQI